MKALVPGPTARDTCTGTHNLMKISRFEIDEVFVFVL
jgi:hypothetical protein